MQTRGYKIRSYVSGRAKDGSEYKNYSLTVPTNIAESLPKGITFIPKMTDDGLLFEPSSQMAPQKLPAWANEKTSSSKRSSPHAQAA